MRNLEYARRHRKRSPSRHQRKFNKTAVDKSDEEFLATTFRTIKFGADATAEGEGQQDPKAEKSAPTKKTPTRATAGAAKQ